MNIIIPSSLLPGPHKYVLGTAQNPVTGYIRGPNKGYIYSHVISIIQLLLSGDSIQSM